MQYLRVNSYALTAAGHAYLQTQTTHQGAFNLVFAHGFTMHDVNYPILTWLIEQGYVESKPLNVNTLLELARNVKHHGAIELTQLAPEVKSYPQLEAWLNLVPTWEILRHLAQVPTPQVESYSALQQSGHHYITQLQVLIATESADKASHGSIPTTTTSTVVNSAHTSHYGWIHTISDDFSTTGLNLGQVLSYLYLFCEQLPTQWGCYSYGTLNSQLLLSMLQLQPQAFAHIQRVTAFMGAPITAHNQLSIPVKINQATRENWSAQAYATFAQSIGYPQPQVELIMSRVQDKDPCFFKAQQQVLQHMWQLNNPIFLPALENQRLMSKWQQLHVATQDAIYPQRNLKRFATQFGLEVTEHECPHLFNPVVLGRIFFNWN